jgi:oligopeptide/dipeptide ABC transporter ATP-binding protein
VHPYTRALISALPEADPELTRNKERLRLRSPDIPSLLNLPAGCPFHPRCPMYEEGLCPGQSEDGVIPELGKAGFRIGFLIVVPSFLLLIFLEPGTAEYAITLVTLVMGVVFLVAVTLLVLYSRR